MRTVLNISRLLEGGGGGVCQGGVSGQGGMSSQGGVCPGVSAYVADGKNLSFFECFQCSVQSERS